MSIMESLNIGQHALKAHGLRLDIHAKNIANVDTPNYVRRIPVLNASEDISFHGVMNAMKEDVSDAELCRIFRAGLFSTAVSKIRQWEKGYIHRGILMLMQTDT
ncbi:hypothetical protein IKQ21_00885 [bacterium]|nr:hypothetical protein [bacterium]